MAIDHFGEVDVVINNASAMVDTVERALRAVERVEQCLVLFVDGLAPPVEFLREERQRTRHRPDLRLQENLVLAPYRRTDLVARTPRTAGGRAPG